MNKFAISVLIVMGVLTGATRYSEAAYQFRWASAAAGCTIENYSGVVVMGSYGAVGLPVSTGSLRIICPISHDLGIANRLGISFNVSSTQFCQVKAYIYRSARAEGDSTYGAIATYDSWVTGAHSGKNDVIMTMAQHAFDQLTYSYWVVAELNQTYNCYGSSIDSVRILNWT